MSATLTYEHKRSLWREGHFGVDDTLTYYHFDVWNTLAWNTLASCLLWRETLWRMRGNETFWRGSLWRETV